jgi:ferredoxin
MLSRVEVVVQDCIGCGLCAERAPENMAMTDGGSTAEVLKQPETQEEQEACHEAAEYCPLGGLHVSNGDSRLAE